MNKRTISPAALHLHIALRSGHDEADRVCPLITTATAAAVRKYEELRSNACGGSSERGSEQVSSASSPVPVTPGDAAAPAVDPRRLTDGELWEAYLSAWRSNMTPNNVPPELGEQGVKRLRAVANAQLAKAAADNAAWSVGVEDELT